ncbi:MAG: YkgJ family cysteine cluster protein [Spirochaetota bacterium]
MTCRPGCGACCIEPSISSPIPGMPNGKPAGVPCVNLDPETHLCRIWGSAEYPDVCRGLCAEPEMCGSSREHALRYLAELERLTRPGA